MCAAFGTGLRDDPAQRSCVLVFSPSSCPEGQLARESVRCECRDCANLQERSGHRKASNTCSGNERRRSGAGESRSDHAVGRGNRHITEPMGLPSAVAVCGHSDDSAADVAPLSAATCLTEWWIGN